MQQDDQSADLPSLAPDISEQPVNPVSSERPTNNAQVSIPAQPTTGPALQQTGGATPGSGLSNPVQAADSDLIEKEWVIRAKQIVEETRDNPYEQQKAIEKFKAEYMKKRYNKNIRVTEN